MKRIAIVGCRPPPVDNGIDIFYSITRSVADFLETLPKGVVVVSGGAMGVDRFAAAIARKTHGLDVVEHIPEYTAHHGKAPLIRNQLIVDDCDELHAWPAPWSRGTWHTVRLAREAGKPVTVHEVKVP